jgi:hypothetical protein
LASFYPAAAQFRDTLPVPGNADEPVIQDMITARSNGFIAPCIPTRAAKQPAGRDDWVHEIKHG